MLNIKRTTLQKQVLPKTLNLVNYGLSKQRKQAINCTFICRLNEFALHLHLKGQYFARMDYSIIKERRALLGLTQQDLADYTGLSLRIIKSIEAGKGNPSVATLSKIAATLGLELVLKVKEVVK